MILDSLRGEECVGRANTEDADLPSVLTLAGIYLVDGRAEQDGDGETKISTTGSILANLPQWLGKRAIYFEGHRLDGDGEDKGREGDNLGLMGDAERDEGGEGNISRASVSDEGSHSTGVL